MAALYSSLLPSSLLPSPLLFLTLPLSLQSYLTEKRCVEALSLRGLLRIWSSLHISSVLHFLTLHGFVNHGFLDDIPRPLPFPQSDRKVCLIIIIMAMGVILVAMVQIRVLIIGAGTAGIAAANHLRNYGHSVSCFNNYYNQDFDISFYLSVYICTTFICLYTKCCIIIIRRCWKFPVMHP